MTRPKYHLDALAAAAGLSMPALSKRLNLSGTQWKQARDCGVGERAADRYAVKLGLHAASVWPEWMDESTAKVSVPCAECAEPFIPCRKGHVYCSARCKNRRLQRQRYATDPEFKDRKRQEAAAYYAEAGEYVRGRMRRYHHANRDAALAGMRRRYRARRAAQGADGTVAA